MAAPSSLRDDPAAEQRQHAVDTGRRVRVVGYLRGPVPDGLDCESPLHAVVSDAEAGTVTHEAWRCRNHRQSRCRPCATRYRRRVQSVAADGLYRDGGFFYLLTLTAPGSSEHYLPSGKRCPCTPMGGVDLGQWNPTAGKRWNHFLVLVERKYLVRPVYFRAAETQERGALHHHVLVWSPRKLSVRTVRSLAIAAGYGHEVDLQHLERGSRKAAYYVSKYVTKSADERDLVPWVGQVVDEESGEVTEGMVPATFRTWSSSRSWGKSMRELVDEDRRRYVLATLSAGRLVDHPPPGVDQVGIAETPPAPS